MILGIGTDIVEIRRIKRILEESNDFLNKIFGSEEIEYLKLKKMKAEHVAGGFAAKEAVAKALGTGIRGFSFTDICICRDSLGKPYVILKNNAMLIAKNMGALRIHLSISHSEESAIAYAILEGEDIENCKQ